MPQNLSSQVFAKKIRLKIPFLVTPDMMTQFRSLSGDHHPVHLDPQYARSRGFRDCIVYGGIMVSQVSRLIGMELPILNCIWTRLTIDFVSPLYVNEEALLEAHVEGISEAVQVLRLKFRIQVEERLIARGNAEVSFGGK